MIDDFHHQAQSQLQSQAVLALAQAHAQQRLFGEAMAFDPLRPAPASAADMRDQVVGALHAVRDLLAPLGTGYAERAYASVAILGRALGSAADEQRAVLRDAVRAAYPGIMF